MKTTISLMLSLSLLLLFSCNQQQKTEKVTQIESGIKQQSSQLLNGTVEALCYSGFRTNQHPDRGNGAVNPSKEEILEDLSLLKTHFNTQLIRMYDCGENTQDVLEVIRDNNLDIKVLLGVWLKAELSAHETCAWLTEPIPDSTLAKNKIKNIKELETGIQLANSFKEIIVAVNVGNEALVSWNDHKVHVDTVISYVKTVQKKIEQPVTVADNYLWWAQEGKDLASVVDFVSIHVYPIWEGKTIDESMEFTIRNITQVKDSLPNSDIVITEAGWATIASEFQGQASEVNQKRYYEELMAIAAENNITTFFFEAFDEDWKGNPDNPLGAEKHWGLFNVDRSPKLVVTNR